MHEKDSGCGTAILVCAILYAILWAVWKMAVAVDPGTFRNSLPCCTGAFILVMLLNLPSFLDDKNKESSSALGWWLGVLVLVLLVWAAMPILKLALQGLRDWLVSLALPPLCGLGLILLMMFLFSLVTLGLLGLGMPESNGTRTRHGSYDPNNYDDYNN
jgi:hypothetical protein